MTNQRWVISFFASYNSEVGISWEIFTHGHMVYLSNQPCMYVCDLKKVLSVWEIQLQAFC